MRAERQLPELVEPGEQVGDDGDGTAFTAPAKAVWTYPLRGVWYFVTHTKLLLYAIGPLVCTLCFAVVATVLLFVFALKPQASLLIWLGLDGDIARYCCAWVSWLIAVVLVLAEAFLLVAIFASVLFGTVQDKVFEWTLKNELGDVPEGDQSCLAGFLVSLGHLVFSLVVFVVTLPVNSIPVVGTVVFCLLNGWTLSFELMESYFDAKGFGFLRRLSWMAANWWQMTLFGAVCMALRLVPLLGLVLFFSNGVSAALLHADLERGRLPQLHATLGDAAEAMPARVEGGIAKGIRAAQAVSGSRVMSPAVGMDLEEEEEKEKEEEEEDGSGEGPNAAGGEDGTA